MTLRFLAPVIGLIAFTLATAAAQPPLTRLVDQATLKLLAEEISGEAAKRNLDTITLWHRTRAGSQFRMAAGHILSQLPEYLADWERREPPPPNATVRDWLQIYALFQHWYRTNDFPKDHKAYGLRLAPLICTNPKEQQTFHQFWQAFWKNALGEGTLSEDAAVMHHLKARLVDDYGTENELAMIEEFWPSHARKWFDALYSE